MWRLVYIIFRRGRRSFFSVCGDRLIVARRPGRRPGRPIRCATEPLFDMGGRSGDRKRPSAAGGVLVFFVGILRAAYLSALKSRKRRQAAMGKRRGGLNLRRGTQRRVGVPAACSKLAVDAPGRSPGCTPSCIAVVSRPTKDPGKDVWVVRSVDPPAGAAIPAQRTWRHPSNSRATRNRCSTASFIDVHGPRHL